MIYWVWLKLLKGIGPHTQRRLLKAFESPKDVYRASTDDLISAGLSEKKAQLVSVTKDLSGPERVLERCVRSGISLVNISQRDFPDRLRILDDMPVLLFYKGGLFEPERTAGIVGPRRCTQETKEKVINVTTSCLKEGQAIISGMALGVDGYAHTAAVKNGGRTIAVVGTGLDICFPKEHETLFEAIEKNGCIFSEYEPGQPALSCHFPRRNALIAALSDELHVIDAGRNSGAMITAEYAKKYGKKVRKQDDPDV